MGTYPNNLGAERLGEAPIIGVAATIAKAVSRATVAKITELSIPHESVLRSVKKAKKEAR